MRNHPYYRPRRPRQISPFFNLPAEIRNQIYQLALTSPNPIDLYPPAQLWEPHLANPPDPILQQRFSKLSTTPAPTVPLRPPNNNNSQNLAFRPQKDLLHVRKSLSTGLLSTCVQIYNEAADYFWRDNIWRFSADPNWVGIFRFLLTIGPRARSRIRRLDLMAPFMNTKLVLPDAARIKNEPKLRMQKLWRDDDDHRHRHHHRRPPGGGRMCGDLVLTLLEEDKALECLNLIVPDQYNVVGLCERDCYAPGVPDEFFPATVRVVVEAGASVDETSLEFIQREGWESCCLAGSRIHSELPPDGTTVSREVETGKCESRMPRYDYLSGLGFLFAQAEEETEEVSIAANGGRVKGPADNSFKLERKLDCFGPCVIVTRMGWVCTCPHWWCTWSYQCRGLVYESMVDLRDREHEQMLREWWAEVGVEED